MHKHKRKSSYILLCTLYNEHCIESVSHFESFTQPKAITAAGAVTVHSLLRGELALIRHYVCDGNDSTDESQYSFMCLLLTGISGDTRKWMRSLKWLIPYCGHMIFVKISYIASALQFLALLFAFRLRMVNQTDKHTHTHSCSTGFCTFDKIYQTRSNNDRVVWLYKHCRHYKLDINAFWNIRSCLCILHSTSSIYGGCMFSARQCCAVNRLNFISNTPNSTK